jgi:hypothetical protein
LEIDHGICTWAISPKCSVIWKLKRLRLNIFRLDPQALATTSSANASAANGVQDAHVADQRLLACRNAL